MVAQACRDNPPRSSAIVRIAAETTDWSSAAKNIPDISPISTSQISLWDICPEAAASFAASRLDLELNHCPRFRVFRCPSLLPFESARSLCSYHR